MIVKIVLRGDEMSKLGDQDHSGVHKHMLLRGVWGHVLQEIFIISKGLLLMYYLKFKGGKSLSKGSDCPLLNEALHIVIMQSI